LGEELGEGKYLTAYMDSPASGEQSIVNSVVSYARTRLDQSGRT
jgi:hypothetical protein